MTYEKQSPYTMSLVDRMIVAMRIVAVVGAHLGAELRTGKRIGFFFDERMGGASRLVIPTSAPGMPWYAGGKIGDEGEMLHREQMWFAGGEIAPGKLLINVFVGTTLVLIDLHALFSEKELPGQVDAEPTQLVNVSFADKGEVFFRCPGCNALSRVPQGIVADVWEGSGESHK